MTSQPVTVYPEHAPLLETERKERLLGQRGGVFWFFGRSGSGKSTLAHAVETALHEEGRTTLLLDGDHLRNGLNKGLGFSEDDRRENLRRAAEVAKLVAENGLVVLACFITPKQAMRDLVGEIIGPDKFHEIFVKTSAEECAARDVKGLYASDASGKSANFSGQAAHFEEPAHGFPGLCVETEGRTPGDLLPGILDWIRPRIALEESRIATEN